MRTALVSAFFEFIATTAFIAISTGTGTGLKTAHAGVQALGTALSFGFTVTGLSYAVANTEAGQMNPILTTALIITKQLTVTQGIMNIGAQIIGSIAGSGIVCALTDCSSSTLLTNTLAKGVSVGGAFLAEAFGAFTITFVMLETIFSRSYGIRHQAPLAVGLVVFTVHLFLIPFTSCGINPARALGPAIVSWTWNREMWLFVLTPFVGMAAAIPLRYLKNTLPFDGTLEVA